MPDRPLRSVMVTTHHRPEVLADTLRSILVQDLGPQQMQIAVLDDASVAQEARAIVQRMGKGRVPYTYLPQNRGQPRIFAECLRRARAPHSCTSFRSCTMTFWCCRGSTSACRPRLRRIPK